MGQLSSKLRLLGDGRGGRMLAWFCPACEESHVVSLDHPMRADDPNSGPWGWNGDGEAPTFTPSVNVRAEGWDPLDPAAARGRCHAIITGGVISFCGDCQHALVGQSVPMPELPPWMCDGEKWERWWRSQMPPDALG